MAVPGSTLPPDSALSAAGEDGDSGPSGEVRSDLWAAVREIPLLIGIAVVVAVLVKTFVAQAFFIPSGSMIPQLQINDRIIVSKLAYDLHSPHRGDIVVFKAPPSQQPPQGPDTSPAPVRWLRDLGVDVGVIPPSTEDFIKRVIGLPGNVVEARDGHVYVDDRLLAEPYLPPGDLTADFGPVTVPPGRLWVLGDNRDDSCDSRCFPEGAIPESSIIGRAIIRVWPLGHASFL
jgi:signal peptidase I